MQATSCCRGVALADAKHTQTVSPDLATHTPHPLLAVPSLLFTPDTSPMQTAALLSTVYVTAFKHSDYKHEGQVLTAHIDVGRAHL